MRLASRILAALLGLVIASPALAGAPRPVVLELFTSQGCSSCPPADALLRRLAADPTVLPLSFHVHYWDYLGWKDPFSSEANTNRQRAYAGALGSSSVYTPQLVIDGSAGVVGSDESKISRLMSEARRNQISVPIALTPDAEGRSVRIHIGAVQSPSPTATIYAMRFKRDATTEVTAGENGGRTLSHVNNVVDIQPLGPWQGGESDYQLALTGTADEGVAVLLQSGAQGQVIGAAQFIPSP